MFNIVNNLLDVIKLTRHYFSNFLFQLVNGHFDPINKEFDKHIFHFFSCIAILYGPLFLVVL